MEIYLDKRAVRQIRVSATDAIAEGEHDQLQEDIMEAFSEEQIEEIERRIDAGDFYDFMTDVLSEWGGDDLDELFELLEAQLADAAIDLKYHSVDVDREDDDDLEDEEPDEDDGEFGITEGPDDL